MTSPSTESNGLLLGSGIGLRSQHVAEVMASRPKVGWLEVHSENYLHQGPGLEWLERLRGDYPLSLHGVGMSLGSAEALDPAQLAAVKALADRLQPALLSEHLSWSNLGGAYLNDLLPLPYTEEALDLLTLKIAEAQERLGRKLLLETPSRYLAFRHSTIEEPEFLSELVRRTGCAILCDVNNIVVSAHNLGFDARRYLQGLPASAVEEIHLAGHTRREVEGGELRIDDHASPVDREVWELYAVALSRFGARPTLVEWDSALPPLARLVAEAEQADLIATLCLGAGHGCAA